MISTVKRPNTSPAMLAQLKLKLSKAQLYPSIVLLDVLLFWGADALVQSI